MHRLAPSGQSTASTSGPGADFGAQPGQPENSPSQIGVRCSVPRPGKRMVSGTKSPLWGLQSADGLAY